MKYGALSHGIVDVDQPHSFKISDGVAGDAPDPPKEGDTRYNHDRDASGLGGNSGKSQFEIYREGKWTTMLTEMDLTSSKDVKNKTRVSDNVIFKLIADSLKDTFISAIGSISVVQQGVFSYRGGSKTDAAAPRWGMGPGDHATFPKTDTIWPGTEYVFPNASDSWDKFDQSGHLDKQPKVDNMEMHNGKRILPGYIKDVQFRVPWPANDPWRAFVTPANAKVVEGRTTGNNLTGTFRSYIGNGRLYSVDVEDGGAGYDPNSPPQLSLDTRGGRGAVISATVVQGTVTSVSVISGGEGYRMDKCIVVEKGSRAREYAKYEIVGEDDGNNSGTFTIKKINIISGGGGYETLPDVFISDGGHSAIIEPVMGIGSDSDKIVDVEVRASGFDYTVTPDIIIRSLKEPTKEAKLKCVIGNNKLLSIKLMKPIPSNFLDNGTVPLTISGGSPTKNAVANMIVSNGVAARVDLVDPGAGYQSEPTVTLPADFDRPTTDVAIMMENAPNHRVEFSFNIFQACGVSLADKHLYDITLFNNLSGTYPLLNPYAGQLVRMLAQFIPQWTPFTNFNHDKYGEYKCKIELFGQRAYYASSVSTSWLGQVTKSRSE